MAAVAAQDLTGEWLCTGCEKMEELLTAVGVGWMMRKAASASGYGVGKLKQTVTKR
jgi:hypothetical protein